MIDFIMETAIKYLPSHRVSLMLFFELSISRWTETNWWHFKDYVKHNAIRSVRMFQMKEMLDKCAAAALEMYYYEAGLDHDDGISFFFAHWTKVDEFKCCRLLLFLPISYDNDQTNPHTKIFMPRWWCTTFFNFWDSWSFIGLIVDDFELFRVPFRKFNIHIELTLYNIIENDVYSHHICVFFFAISMVTITHILHILCVAHDLEKSN